MCPLPFFAMLASPQFREEYIMAKTTAPLLSFGASGAIANTMVYSTWRGIPYVRRFVVPQNPRTVAQTLTRDVFSTLSEMWKVSGSLAIAPWQTFTVSKPLTDRNAFMGKNIKILRPEPDMLLFTGSPGARGGLAADSIVATPGVAQLSIAFVNPAAPTGWVLESAVAIAFPDQAPSAVFVGPITEGEDAVTPFDTVVLTGLDTVLHVVAGWLRWVKPDGLLAYGPSIITSGLPT